MRKLYPFTILLLLPVVLLSGCGPATPAASAGGLGGGGQTYPQAVPPVSSSYVPGLAVVGSGTVEAEPDVAYVSLGVDLKGEDAAAAVADASGRMERILAAIQAAGIADEDVRTAGYNLWVEQRYDPQTGQPTGVMDYHVIHTVRVTVRDLGQVGALLSAAVEAGANTVNEVSFGVAEPEALAAEARQMAIVDAQKRAQEMAGALNVTLGKVLSVSEADGYYPVPYYDVVGRGGGYAAPEVPLPAGSFSVSVSVVVIYELP